VLNGVLVHGPSMEAAPDRLNRSSGARRVVPI
jgi:hypothetical protein